MPGIQLNVTRRALLGSIAILIAGAMASRPPARADPAPAVAGSGISALMPDLVTPIRWASFSKTPADPDSIRARDILRNATRYGLTTWWNERMKFSEQKEEYLFLGKDLRRVNNVREHAGMAAALATCLALGAYDAEKVGVPEAEARARTIRLLKSVAYRHRVNSPAAREGIWGRDINTGTNNRDKFDSCNITPFAALAGWLLWEHLDSKAQELVCHMLHDELGYYLSMKTLYHRDRSGKVLYPGDTKAEEMGWQATLFQTAAAMAPRHPDYAVWMNKGIESSLAAASRPSDVASSKIYHGRPLSAWLNGSNHNEDGTVVNHRIDPHPHYIISTILSNYCAATWLTLAGQPTPEAFRFNADKIYGAFVELKFAVADGYRPPGGTMYVPASSELYSPAGNDKGTNEYIKYALGDADVRHFGGDERLPAGRRGADWEPLHARKVLELQGRGTDGRANQTQEEGGEKREWWIGYHAARLYMTKWVAAQDRFRTTNETFGAKR